MATKKAAEEKVEVKKPVEKKDPVKAETKKAEPVKKWLAEVGAQRIDQMIDPELTFQMAVEDYRRQGYSDRWINERMRSIEMRKELTDEWHRSGIHEPRDFAINRKSRCRCATNS